jgi:hypothetical protein
LGTIHFVVSGGGRQRDLLAPARRLLPGEGHPEDRGALFHAVEITVTE